MQLASVSTSTCEVGLPGAVLRIQLQNNSAATHSSASLGGSRTGGRPAHAPSSAVLPLSTHSAIRGIASTAGRPGAHGEDGEAAVSGEAAAVAASADDARPGTSGPLKGAKPEVKRTRTG